MAVFSMLYSTTRSTLGLLTLDVLLKEMLELPSEVTKYPIEDGGPDISDHITQGNETLAINGSVSATSIEAMEVSSGPTKLIESIELLRDMHASRQPITIVTGLGIYEEMGFTKLSVSRASGDKGGWWLDIDASLIKVVKVKLEEADMPPDQMSSADETPPGSSNGSGTKGKGGKSESSSGTSGNSSKPPAEAKQKSAAAGLADMF